MYRYDKPQTVLGPYITKFLNELFNITSSYSSFNVSMVIVRHFALMVGLEL